MKQLMILALMVMSLAGQNIRHTRRYTIRGGRMAEFESIGKDSNALYQKAGGGFFGGVGRVGEAGCGKCAAVPAGVE